MSLKFASIPPKRLAQSITSASTSFYINNILSFDGTNNVAVADLGSQHYCCFRNDTGTIVEFMEIDPATLSAGPITILRRGLSFYGDLTTQVTARKLDWSANETIVQLGTDLPQVFEWLKQYADGLAIGGAPDASLTSKGIVEIATAAEITADASGGSTTAPIAVVPAQLVLSKYGLRLPTADEKAALAGTGTPSVSNKYVTSDTLTTGYVAGSKTFGSDYSQTTNNSTYAVGEANATTKKSLIAQTFVPTVKGIQGVTLNKKADTGSFIGTVKIALQALSGSNPSGTDLASYTITNAAWLKIPTASDFTITFSTQYDSMTVGTTYAIVISPSTSDDANHPNLAYNNLSANSVTLKYNNSTDGWVTTATAALYMKTLSGNLGKTVQSDSSTGLIPAMVRPYSFVEMNVTGVNSSSVDETVVCSKMLEGGLFTANSGLKLTLSYGARPVGSTVVIRIKLNGTTALTATITQLNNSNVIAGTGIMDMFILNNNATNSQRTAYRTIWLNDAMVAATTLGITSISGNSTASIDTTGPMLLEISFQIATTTNTSWSFNWVTIEKIG